VKVLCEEALDVDNTVGTKYEWWAIDEAQAG
jgi:hypothetical protein